jgi:hypothetical protein
LILIRDFSRFKSITFNFLFWHVVFSMAMGLIGIFHALWHVQHYGNYLINRNNNIL